MRLRPPKRVFGFAAAIAAVALALPAAAGAHPGGRDLTVPKTNDHRSSGLWSWIPYQDSRGSSRVYFMSWYRDNCGIAGESRQRGMAHILWNRRRVPKNAYFELKVERQAQMEDTQGRMKWKTRGTPKTLSTKGYKMPKRAHVHLLGSWRVSLTEGGNFIRFRYTYKWRIADWGKDTTVRQKTLYSSACVPREY